MLLGGSDTSANTVAFLLYYLTLYPDMADRIASECRSAFGADGVPQTLSDLDKLVYTEQAIMETLRIEPVVPYLFRRVVKDDVVGGLPAPKGLNVFLDAKSLNLNNTLWSDPTQFNPDRFAPEKKHDRNLFLPFGAGGRMCPGSHVAMIEMKVVIALLIRHFVFRAPTPLQTEWSVITHPKDNLLTMFVTPRPKM
jgi:cytochrome P450